MGLRATLRREDGFSLIELLVVIVIIGILAAIALMSITKQTVKADDADAKSNARNIVLVVEACNTREDDYRLCESDDNPGIRDAGIAMGGGRGQVVVTSSGRRDFLITALSRSGNVFKLARNNGGPAERTCTVEAGQQPGGCVNGRW